MSAEVIIVSAPSVNWAEMIPNLNKSIENPMRILDAYKIKKESPLALPTVLASINQRNNFDPKSYFSKPQSELNTVHIGVMVRCEIVSAPDLISNILPMYVVSAEEHIYYIHIAGNVNEWVTLLQWGCGKLRTKTTREIYNNIYDVYNHSDIRFCLPKKQTLKDGTFTLETL